MASSWRSLKAQIISTLKLIDPDYPDVVFASVLSCRMRESPPLWVYIVGPSGSGKTEIINMLGGVLIESYSDLSKTGLISGFTTGCKSKGGSCDVQPGMLQECDGKCMVFPDYSNMITKQPDEVEQINSILRTAYDGEVRRQYGGPAGLVKIKSHFSFLACVTQQIEYQISQKDKALGERFISFKPHLLAPRDHIAHAISVCSKTKVWRNDLRVQAEEFLNDARPPKSLDDISGDIGPDLIPIADFAATARSPVVRNRYRGDAIEAPPEPEYGTRLAKQLFTLGKLVAWLGGNQHRIAKRVARGSIPRTRDCILEQVFKHGERTASQMQAVVQADDMIIAQEADNLYYLGLLTRRQTGTSMIGRKPIPVYTYGVSGSYYDAFEIMYTDKWMGMSERERVELEDKEVRKMKHSRDDVRIIKLDDEEFCEDDFKPMKPADEEDNK